MSGISWTEKTWNPVAGCSLVSPGCRNCYAMTMARRLDAMGLGKYKGLTKIEKGRAVWTGKMRLADAGTIEQVRHWRKPQLVFVNSMSDLFHEKLKQDDIFRILDVMAEEDRHRYQILTKRALRMGSLIDRWLNRNRLNRVPDHIWPGVSAEDQRRADERLPLLASIPAATRFVSLEPLLERVDIRHLPLVEWYIAGGESAPLKRARKFDPDWARDIRDAVAGRAAFHFKQLGSKPSIPGIRHPKGADWNEFPDDLRIREWPENMPRIKHAA